MAAPKVNRRQKAKKATRATVLAAARTLFNVYGYEATTIRRIADHARLSTGSVFSNWKDKDELYAEIYGHPPVTPERGRELMAELAALKAA